MNTTTYPTATSIEQPDAAAIDDDAQAIRVRRRMQKKAFATLATVSPAGFPHVAGVIYQEVDGALYTHTMRSSRKARNIAADDRVAVCIPDRRMPVGPPFTMHFQARAELLDLDDPDVRSLVDGGRLDRLTGHGELEEPGSCFVRITPNPTVNSYGIGVSTIGLIRDPLHVGARSVSLERNPAVDTRET